MPARTRRSRSSQPSKQKKAHFLAKGQDRYKRMSINLSRDLRKKYGCRSLPVRKGDEVIVQRGQFKNREGRVINVYRLKYCIYIEKLTRDKANGQQYAVPVHPSNCVLSKLKLTRSREVILERKKGAGDVKGEIHEQQETEDVAMSTVD
mmetsp:Transcript_4557/g.4937  ORF Transcript_4557/g.4937 Transcript_4557/m.4937 type:complete len:149 (-) Transcript_4557:54-500(-)